MGVCLGESEFGDTMLDNVWNPDNFDNLAYALKKCIRSVLHGQPQQMSSEAQKQLVETVEEAVNFLHAATRQLTTQTGVEVHAGVAGWRYSMDMLIQSLLLTTDLRDGGSLRQSLCKAFKLILPEGLANYYVDQLTNNRKLPSKSVLSVARLICDLGHMKLTQHSLAQLLPKLGNMPEFGDIPLHKHTPTTLGLDGPVHWEQADSSPVGRYHWFLREYIQVRTPQEQIMILNSVRRLHDLSQEVLAALASHHMMHALDEGSLQDGQGEHLHANLEEISDLTKAVKSAIHKHTGVPTAHGAGEASLINLFHCDIHSLFCDTGSWRLLHAYARTVFSLTTDMGTESGLAILPKLDVQELFPYLLEGDVQQCDYAQKPTSDPPHLQAPQPAQDNAHLNTSNDSSGNVDIHTQLKVGGNVEVHNDSVNELKLGGVLEGIGVSQRQATLAEDAVSDNGTLFEDLGAGMCSELDFPTNGGIGVAEGNSGLMQGAHGANNNGQLQGANATSAGMSSSDLMGHVQGADANDNQEGHKGSADNNANSVNSMHPWLQFFTFALHWPGMMHIIHNLTADLTKGLECFDEWFDDYHTPLVHWLEVADYRTRFAQTCLQTFPGSHFKHLMDTFTGEVIKWRWGSLVHSIEEVSLQYVVTLY